MFMKLPLSD